MLGNLAKHDENHTSITIDSIVRDTERTDVLQIPITESEFYINLIDMWQWGKKLSGVHNQLALYEAEGRLLLNNGSRMIDMTHFKGFLATGTTLISLHLTTSGMGIILYSVTKCPPLPLESWEEIFDLMFLSGPTFKDLGDCSKEIIDKLTKVTLV